MNSSTRYNATQATGNPDHSDREKLESNFLIELDDSDLTQIAGGVSTGGVVVDLIRPR